MWSLQAFYWIANPSSQRKPSYWLAAGYIDLGLISPLTASSNMVFSKEKFLEDIYEKITSKACPFYGHPAAFICESDLEQIWREENNVNRALDSSDDEYVQYVTEHLLKPLSTLVLINVPDIDPNLKLLCPQNSPRKENIQFPFRKEDLGCLGIQRRDAFFEKQYFFCPIMIENREKAGIIHEDVLFRMPFMMAESPTIGSGGYGDVHVNQIAPSYYRDTTNPELEVGNTHVRRASSPMISVQGTF